MDLRFTPGGAYLTDIQKLRDRGRSNATREAVTAVRLTHPQEHDARLDVYVNFAFQSNGTQPTATASIYTVAIGNVRNIWHFRGVPSPENSVPFPGNLGGEYGSLGYNSELPNITSANLANSVRCLSNYGGGPTTAEVKQALAILIIAVSEAVRFSDIAQRINGVLGGTNSNIYSPPWVTVHSWGGNYLSS